METVSLIDLLVEYEVPPSSIIRLIEERKLRPYVPNHSAIEIEDVSFPKMQVDDIFWYCAIKRKDAETKAELARRLKRHDAIIAGIIGAISVELLKIGGGVLASSLAVRSLRKLGENTPAFSLPIEITPGRFAMRATDTGMQISLQPGAKGPMRLLAVADGTVDAAVGLAPGSSVIIRYIQHGGGWYTRYCVKEGSASAIAPVGAYVGAGATLFDVTRSWLGAATAEVCVWHRPVSGGAASPRYDAIGWPTGGLYVGP